MWFHPVWRDEEAPTFASRPVTSTPVELVRPFTRPVSHGSGVNSGVAPDAAAFAMFQAGHIQYTQP
jgi:hypothetical protein